MHPDLVYAPNKAPIRRTLSLENGGSNHEVQGWDLLGGNPPAPRRQHRNRMKGSQWRATFGCLGAALFATGIAGMVRAFAFGKGSAQTLDASETLATFGLILIVGSVLAKYRITVEESYKLGYDIGNEKGYKEGRKTGKPTVVNLPYPRDEAKIRQQPE